MALGDITGAEIIKEIAECDRLGRETLARAHGFKRARRYLFIHDDRLYESEASVGVAHGYLVDQGPLEAKVSPVAQSVPSLCCMNSVPLS